MITKKLNNFKVHVIPGMEQKSSKEVRGSELFENPYGNIGIIAGTASGKTTLTYNILEKTAYNSDVIIFSPTYRNDNSFKQMEKMLLKKKCRVQFYEHYIDYENNINRVEELIDMLKNDEEEEEKKVEPKVEFKILSVDLPKLNQDPTQVEIKEKPKKKRGPITADFILYFDDLSSMMRHSSIHRLLCYSRQYKMRVIINIHSSTDLLPSTYANLNYILLFGNQNIKKIQEISNKAGVEWKDPEFLTECYEFCTMKPKSFLYINTKTKELRCNFDKRIDIEEE